MLSSRRSHGECCFKFVVLLMPFEIIEMNIIGLTQFHSEVLLAALLFLILGRLMDQRILLLLNLLGSFAGDCYFVSICMRICEPLCLTQLTWNDFQFSSTIRSTFD